MTDDEVCAEPLPDKLWATTDTEYEAPFARPVKVHERLRIVALHVFPPGTSVAT